jgi:hypothetical protein
MRGADGLEEIGMIDYLGAGGGCTNSHDIRLEPFYKAFRPLEHGVRRIPWACYRMVRSHLNNEENA